MENYEFDILVDRRGTGNEKYDNLNQAFLDAGAISYSGAELDVKAAPCIRKALSDRALGGIYGYTKADRAYYDAVTGWMKMRRGWEVKPEWVVPSYGTMQTICTAIRAFTDEGDGIIVQPPVYVLYDREIRRTKRVMVNNPLIYENGCYRMDFEQLESVMKKPENKLMILCNPHNPIMDVWERKDLERVADLAETYGVLVVADEIFAEHTYGERLTPYAEVGTGSCIVATSLGKAFNFTGSSHANAIIPDKVIREAYIEQRNSDHFGSIDPFIYTALLAAYTEEGGRWIDALLEYSAENIRMVTEFFHRYFPQVTVCRHRAGTLLWVDFNGFGMEEKELQRLLQEEALFLCDTGSIYGKEGTNFVRIEVGTPRKLLKEALDRLLEAGKRRGLANI